MSIANNKKAFHDYFIEDQIEAGLVLDGWEVKAIRAGRVQLKEAEINKLIGKTERAGYTIVPLNLHYHRGFIKMDIGLAKGKKQHDKRQSLKEADWKREKQRILKGKV